MTAGQTAGLARGPQARKDRAAVARGIRAGTIDVLAIVDGSTVHEETEAIALEMRLETLLRSVPMISGDVAARICATAGVLLEARLCTLTTARRAALARALRKEIAP